MTPADFLLAAIPLIPVVGLFISHARSNRAAGVREGRLMGRIEHLEKAAENDAKTQEQLAALNVVIARLQEQVATLTEEVRRLRSTPEPATT